jgi:hypothetical protein
MTTRSTRWFKRYSTLIALGIVTAFSSLLMSVRVARSRSRKAR